MSRIVRRIALMSLIATMFTGFFSAFTTPLIAQGDGTLVPASELADENGQFITVNGAELYVIDEGERDAPAVLLLHGFGGSTVTWNPTIPALVDAGYRVIAYDRPPFGLSDKSPSVAMGGAAQADYAVGLLDALEVEATFIVGHSQGGDIAARIASAYPERVLGLGFVAAAVTGVSEQNVPGDDIAPMPDGFESLFGVLDLMNPESVLLQGLLSAILTPATLSEILLSAYYDPDGVSAEQLAGYQRVLRVEGWPAGFLAYLAAANNDEAVDLDALAAMDWPVVIIWGADDTWVPITQGERLARIFTEATVVTFDQTGHLPMEEQPQAFNDAFVTFLETAIQG